MWSKQAEIFTGSDRLVDDWERKRVYTAKGSLVHVAIIFFLVSFPSCSLATPKTEIFFKLNVLFFCETVCISNGAQKGKC